MNILIVGCGKTGSRLANILSHQGHAVSVLDRRASSFNKLDDNFNGFTIAGVPMDLDVLRQAGIESCDVVATVTDDDNIRISSCILGFPPWYFPCAPSNAPGWAAAWRTCP